MDEQSITTNDCRYNKRPILLDINAKEFLVPIRTPEKPKGDVNSGTYVIPGAPTAFKNFTDMRVYYPSGVSSSHPAYATARDGDKDGWACEL